MKKQLLAILTALILSLGTIPAYAHSGRTDAAGGHHDYNNVSGLGSYHYHHGFGPHLHPNGVCPYSASVSSGTNNTTAQAAPKTLGKTVNSDINVYINGYFIPTVNFNNTTYVVAEDLNNYGFDVVWNQSERSLKLTPNTSKSFAEVSAYNSSEIYDVQESDIITYFYNGTSKSYVNVTSYNIGGKTIVNLANIGSRVWDSQNRCVYVTL